MWEYTVLEFHYGRHDELRFRDELDRFGALKWELVSVQKREPYTKIEKHDIILICIFKKPNEKTQS